MSETSAIQLGEICERLQVGERDARYVLERGYVPRGVPKSPESGNHRQFGPAQALWLGMVLRLKQAGINTRLAAKVADYAFKAFQGATQSLRWDGDFLPGAGLFEMEYQYQVEFGDGQYVRFLTDALPGDGGQLKETSWSRLKHGGKLGTAAPKGYQPCVVIRLDLSLIARLLARSAES